MKLFTIVAARQVRVLPGISMHGDSYPHIRLSGKGTLAMDAEFGRQIARTGSKLIHSASLLWEAEGRRMLLPEADQSDGRALVRVISEWPAGRPIAATPQRTPCPNRGKPTQAGPCSLCGQHAWEKEHWFLFFRVSDGWFHPEFGEIENWRPVPALDLGITGGLFDRAWEMLVVLSAGDNLRFTTGNPIFPPLKEDHYLRWDGKELRSCSWKEVFLRCPITNESGAPR